MFFLHFYSTHLFCKYLLFEFIFIKFSKIVYNFNILIRSSLIADNLDGQSDYWIYYNMFSNGVVWLSLPLQLITALLPDLLLKVAENSFSEFFDYFRKKVATIFLNKIKF